MGSCSPEFEFWSTSDPSPPPILTADKLFTNGVLLPLHPPPPPHPSPPPPVPTPHRAKLLPRASPELNIHLWPFRRSRSAGTASTSSRPGGRKASSAPCSRSNSRREKEWNKLNINDCIGYGGGGFCSSLKRIFSKKGF